MSEKLVSVIITTYKRDFEIVERGMKSVLSQSYSPIELIVVDDNPADSEYRTAMEQGMADYPDVKYIKHEVNSGAQVSRNDGIKAASGAYFAFLDDDDIWFDEKLEKQMKCFDEGVGLVYCKGYLVRVSEAGEKKSPYNMSASFIDKVNFNDMLYGDYIGTTTQAVISRAAIEKCGMFDVNMPARQDYEMWIRISQKFDCAGADEYLFNHYVHEGEQISKSSKKALMGYQNIYNKYNKYFTRTARFHMLFLISRIMFREKLYVKACANAVKAGFCFIMAFLLEHSELRKRMSIHNNRKQKLLV